MIPHKTRAQTNTLIQRYGQITTTNAYIVSPWYCLQSSLTHLYLLVPVWYCSLKPVLRAMWNDDIACQRGPLSPERSIWACMTTTFQKKTKSFKKTWEYSISKKTKNFKKKQWNASKKPKTLQKKPMKLFKKNLVVGQSETMIHQCMNLN